MRLEIAYDELLAAIQSDKKPLVIDVRKPEEIAETGRLPGSHNLPRTYNVELGSV